MKDGEQIFVLDTESVEESYPSTWRKTNAEAKEMSSKDKVDLACAVGDTISKEQFETEMPKVFGGLRRAWEMAHR